MDGTDHWVRDSWGIPDKSSIGGFVAVVVAAVAVAEVVLR
jgi:hypothetical protein